MKTKIRTLMASFVVASAALLGAMGNASAADQWFTLSEQAIKAADPSAEIKSTGGRWEKDVKQVKISVDGADVQVTKLVLHWDNRKDDTMTSVGTLKSGGENGADERSGIKARLKSVTVQYQILGGAPTANLKVWGYD
jgi:hypothetical protein